MERVDSGVAVQLDSTHKIMCFYLVRLSFPGFSLKRECKAQK